MERLMHNQTIRVISELGEGMYRIVLNEVTDGLLAIVRIDQREGGPFEEDARPRLIAQHKYKSPNTGQIRWVDQKVLEKLWDKGQVNTIELSRQNFNESEKARICFEHRKAIMAEFLNFDSLRNSILGSRAGSIGALVKAAVEKHRVSAHTIYKCWSLLCRYGFMEDSLRVRYDRCGAPGATRDCEPGGRKKAGRKTNRQRLAVQTGEPAVDGTPGMSSLWRHLIMIADSKIPSPKPRFKKRYSMIITDGFVKHFRDENGEKKPQPLDEGLYPNREQVRRIIEVETPSMQKILEMTTKGHYAGHHRPMKGKAWEHSPGPGHTLAIDSTIWDIYLRSSVNRAWPIGRPIVYVIVDVWSTAILGFYMCLRGPSWDMAKIALYNTVIRPELYQSLWKFTPIQTLNPAPTMPAVLLCDRGEYLQVKAKDTMLDLVDRQSFTPPYRGDLKGNVEVIHRIGKDHQAWIPGAIDARKKELELRRFDSSSGIFTLPEYVRVLSNIFADHNLTADRTKRLTTAMIADGVRPTPAAIWRWGHEVGCGFQRHFPEDDLIKKLLCQDQARVTRSGIMFNKLEYQSDVIHAEQWTGLARNYGSWDIPCHHYPGTVSRIWIPNEITGVGRLELKLSDTANATENQTYEEVEDAFAYNGLDRSKRQHENFNIEMDFHHKNEALVAEAKAKTRQADQEASGPKPSIPEARALESKIAELPEAQPAAGRSTRGRDELEDDDDSYSTMLAAVLNAKRDR